MGRRGIQLLCLIVGLTALALVMAGAAVAAAQPKAVKTQAPGGLNRLVADGSKLLLFHSGSVGKGTLTRVYLDGTVDRSFGERGTIKMELEDVAVQPDGKILVATSG
jgi:hypothetical protein